MAISCVEFPPNVTCEQLESAQEILQAGHDYIERFGFRINTYAGPVGQREFGAPRCYIGTVRGVAGLRPRPGWLHPDEGLPDLKIALRLLDYTVSQECKEKVDLSYIASLDSYNPGRVAEAVGLAMEVDSDIQQEIALSAFRRALTEVYYKLEELRGGHDVGEESESEQKELSLVG